MQQVQALIFLNVRQIVNGVKRAVSSARRLIGLIFFVAYYLFFFARPFGRTQNGEYGFNELQKVMSDKVPQVQVSWLYAIIFIVFFGFMVLTSLSITGYNGRFKQADVDTLFATPVDRKWILIFRFLRDSLISTLVPLLVAVIFMRPAVTGFAAFIKGITNPHAAAYVTSLGFIAWLLSSLVWSAWGYAASLYFNRTDVQFEARRAWLFRGIFLAIFAVMIVVSLAIRAKPEFQTIVSLVNSPGFQLIGLTATLATKFTLGLATGDTLGFVLSLLAFICLAAAGLWVAIRQVDWMYEIGATSASKMSETTDLQRKGDLYGMYGARARQGKLKSRQSKFLTRWEPTGTMALVWRESVLFLRVGLPSILLALAIGIFMQVLFLNIPTTSKRGTPIPVDLLLLAMGIGMPVFTAASMSMVSFIEMLRRGDLLKPLPFSPGITIFFEVIGKSIPSVMAAVLLSLFSVAVRPALWQVGVSGILAGSTLAISLVSLFCLLTILFPDYDDPTQRGFRGIMQLLGMVIVLAVPVGLFAIVFFFGKVLVSAALAFSVASAAIAFICAQFAGNLYRDFNPSE